MKNQSGGQKQGCSIQADGKNPFTWGGSTVPCVQRFAPNSPLHFKHRNFLQTCYKTLSSFNGSISGFLLKQWNICLYLGTLTTLERDVPTLSNIGQDFRFCLEYAANCLSVLASLLLGWTHKLCKFWNVRWISSQIQFLNSFWNT